MAEQMQSATDTSGLKRSIIYNSPIGPLQLVATRDGISALKFLFGRHGQKSAAVDHFQTENSLSKEDTKTTEKELIAEEDKEAQSHLNVCIKWLDAYFEGTILKSDPPLPKPALALPSKSMFFHSVWDTLSNTSIGETVSYKELAKLSGSPKAARAVGQAVKNHCIPILVPCHRVVKSRGERKKVCVGEYSGGDGISTKEWLLEHEKKILHL